MKQVWQADDGTIFEKEIDCERYEDRLADFNSLRDIVLSHCYAEEFETWIGVTNLLTSKNPIVLIRYIKTLGEKNGN